VLVHHTKKYAWAAVECGMLSFEALFMPFMLAADGRSLVERVNEAGLLPAPEDKVVSLSATRKES
jgi:hypothetical protein